MLKIKTKIKDAFLVKPKFHEDERGVFFESFNRDQYTEMGISHLNVAQINHSISKKNVLRGLHYQARFSAQSKLVWVSSGEIIDVFVDLREYSPTYGMWDRVHLTNDETRLFVPKGCAHGFLSLTDNTQLNYICSNPYDKSAERTLIWNDPQLMIDWNLPVSESDLIISDKDKMGLTFNECEKYNDN